MGVLMGTPPQVRDQAESIGGMAFVQCSGSREGPTSATAGRVQGAGRSSSAASLFAKSCTQGACTHHGDGAANTTVHFVCGCQVRRQSAVGQTCSSVWACRAGGRLDSHACTQSLQSAVWPAHISQGPGESCFELRVDLRFLDLELLVATGRLSCAVVTADAHL